MTEITKGCRVRFTGADPAAHQHWPEYYPAPGTVGVVTVAADPMAEDEVRVQWPESSTSGNDEWWALSSLLEVVEDDTT